MVVSISRIPDHGIEVFFVRSGCAAQIGVEFLGPKFWGGDGQADIFLAGGYALFCKPAPISMPVGKNM
jgi:hypothetical protein